MQSLKDTYSGKKVFVTGHTGFKGSWMIQILSMLGAKVKGYALAPETELNLFNELSGAEICESELNDLRNKEALIKSIKDFHPDFVFHLAAQPLVRLSYEIPSETFEVNAIGTANLLDAVRQLNHTCSVVLITTDKVYHNNEWEYPYREDDRLGGYDPYSASKACAELVIDSFRNSFFNTSKIEVHGKALAVGRAGNVIGGGDWSKDRLIPDIVKSLYQNNTISIRNPNAVRPWQHVLDCLNGYLVLVDALVKGNGKGAWNFGPSESQAKTVADVSNMAGTIWGAQKNWEQDSISHPHEADLLLLNSDKARSELGWRDKLNFVESVEWTVNWYKSVHNGNKPLDETLKNIRNFESR